MHHPRLLLGAMVGAFCLLAAVYSVVTPLFEAPDEVWHFSFIHTLAATQKLPVQPTEGKDMWLRESGQPPLYHLLAALLIAPLDSVVTTDFRTFVRFNPDHPFVTPHSDSPAPNLFIHTPQEAFPWQGMVLAAHLVRLLTVVWGAGTVVGTYLVAREVMPGQPVLALAAMAVTAFNPHFLFISSVVNNDAAVACLATLTLWLTIRLAKGHTNAQSEAALGLILGLALLSKLSALALPALIILALAVRWWVNRDRRPTFYTAALIFTPALAVAGWWYGRNWLLYGDPLAWRVWLIDIGVHQLTLPELLRQFTVVGISFWEPYDQLFPAPVLVVLAVVLVATAAGWLNLIRQVWQGRSPAHAAALLIAGAWLVLIFASLVQYMRTTPAAAGRLLFPTTSSIAVLLMLGLAALSSAGQARPAHTVAGALATALFALSIATPFLAIAPRFPPARLTAPQLPDLVPLTDDADLTAVIGARLLGVDVEPALAEPGQMVQLSLYWQVERPTTTDWRVILRLWTPGGRLLAQQERPPGRQTYPPDLWQPGDIIRDPYWLRLDEEGTAAYRIAVQVSADGAPTGERSTPAVFQVKEVVDTAAITHPLAYRLGDHIELIGYDHRLTVTNTLPITLYWRVSGPVDENYTLFAHLIDENGVLLSQQDGPPLAYDYPTSHWQAGDVLADTHVVPLPADWQDRRHGRLLVGLYRLADGLRLPAYDTAGQRLPDDAIVLDLGLSQRK